MVNTKSKSYKTYMLNKAKDLYLYSSVIADGFELITKTDLFRDYAPQFAFELNPTELLAEALKRKFIIQVGDDQYLLNGAY